MTEFTQSIPLERSTLLPTCLVVLACLLVTLAILLTPARDTKPCYQPGYAAQTTI